MFASVQLALLGPLEVTSGQGRVVLSAPKERAVLEMLALRAGRPVPAELLYEGLWGAKRTPLGGQGPAHLYLPPAPGALPGLRSHDGRRVPPASRPGLRGRDAFRAGRPRGAPAPARPETTALAASVLQEGLGLWRGRPCPELTEHSWATAEIARLEELRREAEEELMAELRLAMGEGTRLVGELEAAVAAEPLRERRWAQLLLAYYRAGRQADALRAFARLRSTLAEELGVSPSAELVALEQKVLLQSPELDERPLSSEAAAGPAPPLGGCRPAPKAGQQLRRPGRRSGRGGQARRRAPPGHPGRGWAAVARPAWPKKWPPAWRAASPGGAHFVALAPLADPGLVPVAVAEALGVRPQSGRPPAEVVAEVIGHRETLAVLDNCEHLVQAVAELVEGLLSAAPGLRVLATSREPLRIGGETVWRVPSLEVPPPEATAAERRGCRGGRAVRGPRPVRPARPCAWTTTPSPPSPRSPAASTACPSPSSWPPPGWAWSTWPASSSTSPTVSPYCQAARAPPRPASRPCGPRSPGAMTS